LGIKAAYPDMAGVELTATRKVSAVSMTRSSRNGNPQAIASCTAASWISLVPTRPDRTTAPSRQVVLIA
jgi:hypothetical protein